MKFLRWESRKFATIRKKQGKKLVTICSVAGGEPLPRQSKRNYIQRRSDWGGPPLLSLAERPEYLSRNRSREFRRDNWPSKGSQFGMLGEQRFFLVKIHGRQFLHAVPIYQTIRVTVVPKWNTISIRQASSQQLLHDGWTVASCFLTLIFWYRFEPYSTSVIVTEVVNLPDVLNCFNLTVVLSFFFFFPRWFQSMVPVRSEYGYLSGLWRFPGSYECVLETIDKNRFEKLNLEAHFEILFLYILNYYCKYFEGLFKNLYKTIVL